eukprot:TRINITY_DN15027_c0_g1_i1.p1 TRINITY_DN15027_c0_g1~~TRINITY_DN15027_c0_g1_i1.p1  ORF type:complete len:470 (+),score=95.10 TRINITY_DN15027_c0_g1_i1:68-1477(+)
MMCQSLLVCLVCSVVYFSSVLSMEGPNGVIGRDFEVAAHVNVTVPVSPYGAAQTRLQALQKGGAQARLEERVPPLRPPLKPYLRPPPVAGGTPKATPVRPSTQGLPTWRAGHLRPIVASPGHGSEDAAPGRLSSWEPAPAARRPADERMRERDVTASNAPAAAVYRPRPATVSGPKSPAAQGLRENGLGALPSRQKTPRPATGASADLESTWRNKYKFFSGKHMTGTGFNVYARARKDPFNKDPSWGRSIVRRVANEIEEKGMTPNSLFESIDVSGDGALDRAEMRLALTSVLPSLSDMEAAAIFDTIDEDGGGEVSIKEFVEATEKAKAGGPINPKAADRWRNPIHRILRMGPARIDGWDHLEEEPAKKNQREFTTSQQQEVMGRLQNVLLSSPRALKHQAPVTKYYNFGGGADESRFRRSEWNRSRSTAEAQQSELPDPGGPELRPGWFCVRSGGAGAESVGFRTPR